MQQLTSSQRRILELIRQHIEVTGYPPTRAEIARELGFKSANAAQEHLKALARKGAIEIIAGTSRGLRLPESAGIPIVGRVAAGSPILAQEHIEGHCDIAPGFFKPAADYLLRVSGDSMMDIGIFDNDLLAVHKTAKAASGAVVVARIDDEVTVKRLRRGKRHSRLALLPENPAYSPIEVDLARQDFAIEGLSVGVLRRGC